MADQKTQLSPQAESLLRDMARDHGLRELSFNNDGLIPVKMGGVQMALAYSGANDSIFMMGMIDEKADGKLADPWRAFETCSALSSRRTRLAFEPKTGAKVMICELFLAGIDYRQLANALDTFAKDCRDVEAGRVIAPVVSAAPPPQSNADEVIIRM